MRSRGRPQTDRPPADGSDRARDNETSAARLREIFAVCDESADQLRERLGLDRRQIRELSGERRLQLAMIEQAIKDLLDPDRKTTAHEIQESRIWMNASYGSHRFPDIATFDGCCESLGLDPDGLRCAVTRLMVRGSRPRMNFAALGDNTRRRDRRRARIVDPRRERDR